MSREFNLSEDITNRLGVKQQTISIHLQKMPELAKLVNTDLSKGFSVSQVAEKHGWAEPLVWSLALEGKEDLQRFKALNWELRAEGGVFQPVPGNVEADLFGNGYLQFSSLFQPDLMPADNSRAFDIRRLILSLKMCFYAQFRSRFLGILFRP